VIPPERNAVGARRPLRAQSLRLLSSATFFEGYDTFDQSFVLALAARSLPEA
jgi:hypothetical protein